VIRGVLFDSGDTLIGPVGGRWNPRYDFEEILLHHIPDAPMHLLDDAIAEGERALNASPSPLPRDEYHKVMLSALGIEPLPVLLADLDRPVDRPAVEPFPEVVGVLEALRGRGVKMAIVSDNWPGLDKLYAQLGLRHYFEKFVISAVLGCRKPDPRMYTTASDGLGLAPAECVFVDDDPELVTAAAALGYHGIIIDRFGSSYEMGLPIVYDLKALIAFIDAVNRS
jgi:putative hydrolase of the HAD superfamily